LALYSGMDNLMFRGLPLLSLFFLLVLGYVQGQEADLSNFYIDSLRLELPSSSDSSRVDILNALSYNFYYYNLDSTEDYASRAVELATRSGYLQGLAEAQRLMGVSAMAQNKEKEAYEWLIRGLETAESANYVQGIADNLNSIGIFFSYAEDYKRAISYYKRSVDYQIKAGNKLREGLLYTNIGHVYLKVNKMDSSGIYFEKSKAILDSIADGRWLSMVYSQYGDLLLNTKKFEKAEAFSLRALQLSQEHGQTMHMRRAYQNLSEIYFEREQYARALEMAMKALDKSSEIAFMPYLVETYEILFKIYKAQNKIEEALKYHEIYTEYLDSLRFDQINSKAELLAFQLELERKEAENALLRAENEIHEAQSLVRQNIIERRTIYVSGLTAVLVLVSILAIFLFRMRQKEREANKKLAKSNEDLEAQKKKLSSTLKMVEHLNAQLQAQNNAINQSAIVSITDLEGHILSVNDNFCRVTEYPREDLIGKKIRMLRSDTHDKGFFRDMWKTITLGQTWRGEIQNRKRSGDLYWVDCAVAPVFDDNGKPKRFFTLQFEITKRKNYVDELASKGRELEELNKLKDKLLSVVSHDFRSPLNSLQGTLNLMIQGGLTEEEFKMLAHGLVDKLDHTYNLLENLLSWAKSQMQGMKIYPKKIDLSAVAEDCTSLLAPIAGKKLVHIKNEIAEQVEVFADNEMVKLVLRNLLSNAIKFSHSRGAITLKSQMNSDKVIVSVADDGLGISNENQAKVFNFEDFSTYGTSNEKGMGLGLLLCKDFVQRNGGKIWFESELEKGSTFYFTLPTKKVTVEENQTLD